MDPQVAVRTVLSKYADFNGRARRSEFWWFNLALFVAYIVLAFLSLVSDLFTVLFFLASIAAIVPTIAVAARRLHDTGRSGWWQLMSVVPFAGIVLIVFWAMDSHPDNQYGPNPKALTGGYGGGAPAV